MSSLVDLVLVQQGEVAKCWGSVERFVQLACTRGPCPMDALQLRDDCALGQRQIWVAFVNGKVEGCAITTFIYEPGAQNICEWTAAAGIHARNWMHCSAIIEDWARRLGCQAMRSFSRKGFRRQYLNDYRVAGVVLEKVL